MGDWPQARTLALGGGTFYSVSLFMAHALGNPSFSSAAWPAANLAIFVPWKVPGPFVAYKITIGAGATAAGNFDVGIYDIGGNRLVSSGTTAKASSAEQVLDITDTTIGPGLYYLAMSADGTNNYITAAPTLQNARLMGIMQADTAFVLPATVTFAAAATGIVIPALAIHGRPY